MQYDILNCFTSIKQGHKTGLSALETHKAIVIEHFPVIYSFFLKYQQWTCGITIKNWTYLFPKSELWNHSMKSTIASPIPDVPITEEYLSLKMATCKLGKHFVFVFLAPLKEGLHGTMPPNNYDTNEGIQYDFLTLTGWFQNNSRLDVVFYNLYQVCPGIWRWAPNLSEPVPKGWR